MAEENVSRLHDELAARQHGVVDVRQLYELGLSDDWVAMRVQAGWLHRVHRGVYAVGSPRLTARGLFMAAVLACGPTAVLSHGSAAALWRIVGLHTAHPRKRIHVSVSARGGRSRAGLVLHRRNLPAEALTRHQQIPVTSVELTLVDLGTQLAVRPLERAVDEALYLRLTTQPRILEALGESSGRRGAGRLRNALERRGGRSTRTRSDMEEVFLALCRRHRLPQPLVNASLLGLTVDFLWEVEKVIVEADSRRAHNSESAFQDDRDRDSLLATEGYRILRFTWWDMTRRPGVVAHRVRRVLARS